ncbi:cellulase family glycosylhydrolase [Reyranella aquatilis]|uniref:cellulase n=1 Tax=Reyranella aquatilis TaxID=2035356 RepID=A0ABS8L149_9HYPH|nr:Calx-beta domain-containing protein [Reyranella aquatilis]MCC8432068.1 cellulase family glycosylhydrolase [Reyranella aquatilis]
MATVKYTVKDNWGSGFIGNMTVDGGTSGVHGWTIEFDAGFAITNIWGAEIVSRVGTHYVLRNASYNGDVSAGGSVTFGFQATPGATGGTAATGLTLNGAGEEPPPSLPTISVGDASVVEGNSGTVQMNFTVSLSKAASGPVTVAYATADGTATAGSDYVARSGTITFAAGETQKTISVTVNGDKVAELNETLALRLSSPSGATIADGAAVGTITTDDVVVPKITIADATIKEGDGGTRDLAFTITLSEATTAPVSVTYGTEDGTAKAGLDYVAQTGTVTFAPGETSKVINIKVSGDTAIEGNETLKINLTGATGGKIADRLGIGTIVNDDATISIADASVTEGHAGTSEMSFTVTLSSATSSPVTVGYATSNVTAKAGQDYVAQSGVLTFAAGETSKVIRVQVTGDTAVEANETLRVTLASPTGATLRDGSALGTIVNDDSATPLPSLSITDASSAEGSAAAPGQTSFTVSLSAASATPVTVNFATANGTAVAGSDYVAQSGTLTFAAGETQKTIQVATIGDATVEANEGFSIVLSSPSGATLADATGTGTIVNDDVAAGPTLAISDATVIEGNPGSGAAPGWLSTSGNQIVDSAGHSVQIAGVNWFGFESSTFAPHGLWTRGYKDMMDQMVDLGFNTIRLPFSSEMLHTTAAPNGIDFSKNPDLQGLSALQIMDKIVDYADQIGLKIILDHHRSNAGAGTSENGLWYNSQYTQAAWINDWKMLAARYADDQSVIGADLHNEPYNGTWGGGGANDWALAAETAGNAIGTVNPNWLIFVEGIGTYKGQSYWWGGNLMGVRDRPIDLALDNKLVYSAHDYPNSVYEQSWFQGPDFPANLPAKFDQMWGYIYKEGIAPVWIGEFGTKLVDPKDAPWLEAITSYLGGDFNNDGTSDLAPGQKGPSWTFWSWNPNSGDTGGILNDNWNTVNQTKMGYLTPIEYQFHEDAPGDGSSGGPTASFVLTLSEAATQEVTVDYQTVYGEAGASDFIASSGHVTFAVGEQSKTITIEISPDKLVEGNEHFGVVLSNAVGATITRATGTGTIVDDDTATTTTTTPTTPTPPTDPTTPSSGSGDLEAMFAIVNSWSGGFNGSVTLENDGTAAVTGWQVKIETTNQITDLWNAVIVSHDASGYVIGNAAYNGTIAQDGETSFGFVATGAQSPSTVHIDLLHL